MATDIDIEEHDVLEDSKVMGIFPDLSLVKIEIPDDDEDTAQDPSLNPEAIPDSTTGYDSPLSSERTSESPHVVSSTQEDGSALTPKIVGIQSAGNFFNNRIVLGQKSTALPANADNASPLNDMSDPCTLVDNVNAETSNEVKGLEIVNNCIVLGQKPSSVPRVEVETSDIDLDEEELMKCYSATVLLDDWGSYLNSSDSYCQECETLFATTNALDAHKMMAHSFLVAVEAKEPVPGSSKACFVCHKSFANHTDLIQHLYHHVSTTQECKECHKTFLSKKLLSEHMKTHLKQEIDVVSEKGALYKCKVCRKCDRSLVGIKKHLVKNHCRITVTPEDYSVVDGLRCGMCTHVSEGIEAYRAHFLEHKSYRISTKTYAKPQSLASLPKDEGVFVPKSTLFCCSECDVHFTSLSVAFSHKMKCPDTQSQDCAQCPLTFASACMESHEVQHLYVDNGDFDVLDLATDRLIEKMLCICPKCDVQCSLRSLWSHVGSCPVTPSYHCQVCDIYLDKAAENDHRFAHDAHRLSKSDFITVEYLTTEDLEADNKVALPNVVKVGTKRKLDGVLESRDSKRPKGEICESDKAFTYCQNCRFFLPKSSVIKTKAHLAGQCRMHIKRVCSACGLVLSKYSYPRHRRLHFQPGFTFDDFKFFDLQTDKRIKPPVPDIFQCRKCQCHYLQSVSAARHKCPAKDTKFCSKCNRKYSQLAYKVHEKYHDTKLNKRSTQSLCKNPKELVKREAACKVAKARLNQSVGVNGDFTCKDILVIYCVDCKCCYMGDGHKCLGASWMDDMSRAKYRRRTCGVCGIVLGIDCFKNHLKLHSTSGVILEDFKFVNFKRIAFLNKPMPIYYPCKTCRVQFHTRGERRSHRCNTKSELCNVCNLKFSPTTFPLHTPFHQLQVMESTDDNLVYQCTRCTYVFSKEQAVNPICRHSCKGPKKASSHKYCEVCHLDMYKGIYDKHLKDHANVKIVLFNPNVKPKGSDAVTMHCEQCELFYDFENDRKKACLECGAKLSSGRMKMEVYQNQKGPDMQTSSVAKTTRRRYVFYQCKYCKQAIRLKGQMLLHLSRCSFKNHVLDPMKYCPTCDLHLLRKRFHCHEKSHARFPNLCKDTITVIPCGKNSKQPLIEYRNSDAKSSAEGERNVATVGRKYKFYHCRNCDGIVTKMYRFKTHDCSKMEIVRLFHCRICKLNIVLSLYRSHLNYHSTHPDLTARNIHILPFGEKRGVRSVVVDADHVKSLAKLYARGTKAAMQNIKEETTDEEDAHLTGEEAEEVDKDSDVVEVISLSEDEGCPKAKYTLYRCRKCLGCVSSAQKGDYHTMHQPNCTEMKRRRCKLCGLDFVVRFLRPHEEKHRELADFTRENIRIVNFGEASKDTGPSPRAKFVLYQCSECLICSEEPYEHICENVERRTCDICQYDIEASCFSRHLECHKNDTYQRSAIKILPLDSNANSDDDVPLRGRKRTVHGDLAAKKTVDVYKCSCGLHFLCQKSLAKHDFMCQGVAKEKSGLPCSKCNMVFDATQLLKHSISHHGNLSFDIKYNIVESVSKADQCGKCGTEFMRGESCPTCVKPRKSYYKKVLCRKPTQKKTCPKCSLVVSLSNFSRHLMRHQKENNPTKNKNKPNLRRASQIRKRMFECKRCLVLFMTAESYGSHDRSHNHAAPPHEQCKLCKLPIFKGQLIHHVLRFHGNNRLSSKLGRVLYYCAECNVHFFKMNTLQRHHNVGNADGSDHVKVKEVHPCPHCGLSFSKFGIKAHIVAHHDTESYKREDFIIKDVNDRIIWDAKRDLHDIEEDDDEDKDCNSEIEIAESEAPRVKEEPNLSDFEGSNAERASCDGSEGVTERESTLSAVKKSAESVTYYKCTECKVHFFKHNTLQKHIYLTRTNKRRHQRFKQTHACPHCGLTFTRCGLKTHLAAHRNLSCKSQKFIINNVSDTTIHIHSPGVERDEDETKETTWLEVPVKEECVLNESEEMNAENASVNFDDDDNEFVPSVSGIKRSHKGVTYYKCSECDVHFLKYDAVQKHLANHQPIPVYDFLECKLCKLNFKINSLRTHMDHHKNKDFSLDQVHFIVYDRKGKAGCKDEASLGSVKGEVGEETDSIEETQRPDSDENILELLMDSER